MDSEPYWYKLERELLKAKRIARCGGCGKVSSALNNANRNGWEGWSWMRDEVLGVCPKCKVVQHKIY